MPMRIATLLLLFLATGCASANPRPEATPPAPTTPQPAVHTPPPIQRYTMPPPSRPVSSDPGVRTLNPPVVGGLVAETEPERRGASDTPAPAAPPAPPAPPTPVQADDELGAPPAGPLPPIPNPR